MMERRTFLQGLAAGAVFAGGPIGAEEETAPMKSIPVLANDPVIVYESPDADLVYAYSPGITLLPSGRLVATMDQGWKGKELLGARKVDGRTYQGRIYTSDDKGKTWSFRADGPFCHARPFVAGSTVYVLGHDHDLVVMRSQDGGDTWEGPFFLTEGQWWHQAPCNVWYARGRIYLVMERVMDMKFPTWPVSMIAPVVMSADVNADLTQRQAWVFSNELTFNDVVERCGKANLIGSPFFVPGNTDPDNSKDKRNMAPPGWLETNIVQFKDPNHVWHDPAGRTFHLWMRAHTGTTNLACIAKAVEAEDGSITVSEVHAPSGEPVVYMPCPGGQMKFHILFDEPSGLFWLLSSQATDSMTRPDKLPPDRFNLPSNERHRLVLHYSRNCVDWCFACRVADTGAYGQGRHYASMVIDGEDLYVLARSGDHRAASAHDGNLITFHTIHGFRELVY